MDEREEQRILKLVIEAARRNDAQSYVELWVAARWLNEQEPRDRISLLMAIQQSSAALIWMAFLLDAIGKLEAEHEQITDGLPFEHDGTTYVASPRVRTHPPTDKCKGFCRGIEGRCSAA